MTELMSSTYGATEQSPSRPSLTHVPSFDLYDDDDEYEYLPMPEVDEDFLDDEMATMVNGRRECMLFVLLCICSSL